MHKNARNSSTFVQILCLDKMNFKLAGYFFAAACALSVSCSRGGYVSFSGYAQGGTYTVKYNSRGVRMPVGQVRDSVESILREIDASISGYNRKSLLSRYNSGEEISPDRHFSALLDLSERYCELSGGAFDVYAAPLFDIWGFGFTSDSLPSRRRIEEALRLCREHRVLNFNAIAQGYTCDVVADFLHRAGVCDMLVDIGEIYCRGLNPSGHGWTVGVDNPFDGNSAPGADLRGIWDSEGRSCGIVTSGNYRKYYIVDGRKFAHTIDPRNGYPVTHSLLSATVTAPTAAEADALATICMVLGPDGAKSLVTSLEGVEAYLICSDCTWASEGFTFRK